MNTETMNPKENVLLWGLEYVDGASAPRAVKFVVEIEHPFFSVPECPIYKSAKSLYPSVELKMAFEYKEVMLPEDTAIAPALECEDEYVVSTEAVDGSQNKGNDAPKPDYVIRKEDGKINVYTVEQHTVNISDLVAILTIHKCCEDFIRVTTQKEKNIAQKPIEEIIANLKEPVKYLLSQLRAASDTGQCYEESVLDTCTDEFGLTLDQSLKVLALLRASIEKYVEEGSGVTTEKGTEFPYHQ